MFVFVFIIVMLSGIIFISTFLIVKDVGNFLWFWPFFSFLITTCSLAYLLIKTYKINKKFIFYRLYYSIYSLIFSSNINIDICFCLFNVCAIYFWIFYISVWWTSTSITLCIDFILINFQINKKKWREEYRITLFL